MISFTILTDTPGELRTRLIARGILQNVAGVVPTYEGLEYVEVPNPIPGDTRRVFLVKLVREAETDEENGEPRTDAEGQSRPYALRTKFGKWVAANSVSDPIGDIPARRVGTKFWLVSETNSESFGAWQ